MGSVWLLDALSYNISPSQNIWLSFTSMSLFVFEKFSNQDYRKKKFYIRKERVLHKNYWFSNAQ